MITPSVRAVSYAFPAATHTVRELAIAGHLESGPAVLEEFGFARVHVAVDESPYSLALTASGRLLEEHDIDPMSIGLLIYCGTPGTMGFASAADADAGAAGLNTEERFRYPATRLQFDLGLEQCGVLALDQLACTSLFGAVRVARGLMASEGIDRVLCVSSEFFPLHAGREAIYNCTSDAACAVLLDSTGERNRIVGGATVTKGYYWDASAMREEVVAAYFPTAVNVIARTIATAGWRPEDVDWVIPHNVSVRSWEILMRLANLPNARLWSRNVAEHGHTLAGDNFINLRDAVNEGALKAGQRALLFSFGYGAHWTGLALEA